MAYKIFVSHVWRLHHEYYWGLIRLLAQAKRFKFVDLSVPKLRPFDGDYMAVREDILRILRTAGVVLTINTPVISNSVGVKDELREAEELGIPIIAISPPKRHGRTNTANVPAIKRAHKAQWTAKSIVDAIKRVVKKKKALALEGTVPAAAIYELASDAADKAPLSAAEVVEVRGDDEQQAADHDASRAEVQPAVAQEASPRDVLYRDKEYLAPPDAKKSWFKRLWGR